MLGKRFVRKRSGVRAWSETQEKTSEEASSMLDKSFCAKPNKRVWPTTFRVVTQTHPSCFAQKSLSVLCRVHADDRTKKHKKRRPLMNLTRKRPSKMLYRVRVLRLLKLFMK